MVSPVIVQPNSFNTPELGNRYWGTYDIFTSVWREFSWTLMRCATQKM